MTEEEWAALDRKIAAWEKWLLEKTTKEAQARRAPKVSSARKTAPRSRSCSARQRKAPRYPHLNAMEDEVMGTCDGCGAVVPLDQLSLTTFPEIEGLVCAECKRNTLVAVSVNEDREVK